MVQLQLNDTALASELGMFLRRCECVVEHLGPNTLGVSVRHGIDVDAAVRHLRVGRCYRCGEEIEPAVFGLGSPLCLDCRHGNNDVADGLIRDEWARMEVEAYVKVWQALHPAGRVELIEQDGSPSARNGSSAAPRALRARRASRRRRLR
jgi:hypothetical protein